MTVEIPKCDAGCGDDVEISLEHVGLCFDCYGRQLAEALEAAGMGKFCGRILNQKPNNEHFALCLAPHGTEHAH